MMVSVSPTARRRPDPPAGSASLVCEHHRKWSGGMQLDDAVRVGPEVMPGGSGKRHERALDKGLRRGRGRRLAKGHPQFPRNHRDVLIGGMRMRWYLVASRELETQCERRGLGRVAI